MAVEMNCKNCKHHMYLYKWDYSMGGCIHSTCDGFACTALADEGEIIHMVGNDEDTGYCEMWRKKDGDTD